jgi:hypothetical protein
MRNNATILREFIRESARIKILTEQEGVPQDATVELQHAIKFFYTKGAKTGEATKLQSIMDRMEAAGSEDWITDLGGLLERALAHDNRDEEMATKGGTGALAAYLIATGNYNDAILAVSRAADAVGRAAAAQVPSVDFGVTPVQESRFDDAVSWLGGLFGRKSSRAVSQLSDVPPELQQDAVDVMRRMIEKAEEAKPGITKNMESGTFSVSTGQLPTLQKDKYGEFIVTGEKSTRAAFKQSLISATEVPIDQKLLQVVEESGTDIAPTLETLKRILNNVDGPGGGGFMDTFRGELEDYGTDELGNAINKSNVGKVADRIVEKIRKAVSAHEANIGKLTNPATLKDILNRSLQAPGRAASTAGKKVAIGAGAVTAAGLLALLSDLGSAPTIKQVAALSNDVLMQGAVAAGQIADEIEREAGEGEHAKVVTELRRISGLEF